MKTTRALTSLLKKAGVKFACLGIEERCSGDSARRIGDEFLFQQMALQNIETFEKYGVKKILTACPHCFNTLKNEYPQFNGEYEVMHHTQFIAHLIESGRLRAPNLRDGEVTIHDPCYLARINGEVDAQRIALGSASSENRYETPMGKWLNEPVENPVRIAEPEHRGVKTLCCGAGGGRMWMEESADERPSTNRWNELKKTGAETVAVACPFCRIMLDAGKDAENLIRLKDIAEIVHEANRD
jgi:Fe-S oxidoreductase